MEVAKGLSVGRTKLFSTAQRACAQDWAWPQAGSKKSQEQIAFVMSLGTQHTLVGLLFTGNRFPVLRVDGGGQWQLDLPSKHQSLIGRRVRITGVRSEFDMLDVTEADLIG